MEWEKVFANHISDKKLIFKIYELFYSVMRRKGNIATCNNMRTLKAKGNKSGRERLILHDITYKWNISITLKEIDKKKYYKYSKEKTLK